MHGENERDTLVLLNIHLRSWESDLVAHLIDNLILPMDLSFQIQQSRLPRKMSFIVD